MLVRPSAWGGAIDFNAEMLEGSALVVGPASFFVRPCEKMFFVSGVSGKEGGLTPGLNLHQRLPLQSQQQLEHCFPKEQCLL